jgi:hypothetical protein
MEQKFRRFRIARWSEPRLPRWVKINPHADPDTVNENLTQPGEISMREVAEEFLAEPEDAEEDEEYPGEAEEPQLSRRLPRSNS